MKKVFAVILAIAMLALCVAASAEGNSIAFGGMPPAQMQGDLQQGSDGMRQPPQGMLNGQAPNGETPADLPEMNGQAPNGETPADLPEMNGQAPSGEMPADRPGMNGQALNGEMLADLPEMNGETPTDLPGTNGQVPGMIDFDAMVANGVISQETCDAIKAYMQEHRPADQPEMNGGMPTEGEAPELGGLLSDLLKDGVITQAEYDALVAAQD